MRLLSIFLVVLLASSCAANSQSLKQAKSLEQEGNYRDAASAYHQFLFRKPGQKDARAGLQRTGQRVLDDLLGNFWVKYNLEDYSAAVKSYQEAQDFERQIASMQIRLLWADHYKGYFEEALTKEVDAWFKDAAKAIDAGDYTKARNQLRLIESKMPDFEGIRELRTAIEVDPWYRNGVNALQSGQSGKAMEWFVKVKERAPGYRDVRQLMMDLNSKSKRIIAIMPFQEQKRGRQIATEFGEQIVNALLNLNNPLIQLIDRQNVEQLLQEQRLGLSGLIDEKSASRAGMLLGGNAVLIGSVVNVVEEEPALQREIKSAFVRERYTFRDQRTGMSRADVRFVPVSYTEIKAQRTITLTFKYRLLDTESGTILDSDVITRSATHQLFYAETTLPVDQLSPIQGTLPVAELAKWRERFSQSTLLKPFAELANMVEKDVAKEVAERIQSKGLN
jgi:tetratricopeptide (TPR) repeat protein